MTLEVADECTQKEIDVIGLGCSKESFTEHSEVEKLIDELRTGYKVVARHLPHEKYLAGTTKAQDMAFYVLAIYLTRPDVKDSYLPGFINWAHEVLSKDSAQFKKGVLSTLAGVFKHGQREQMMEHAHAVLRTILTIKFPPSELLIQLRNRLIFLKPRVASWRYQRGSRSLAANLQQSQPVETKAAISVNDEDDHDYDVPEEIEEVLCSKRHWAADQSLIKELCRPGTRRSTGHFSSRHRHSDHLRLVRLRKNAYLQLSLFVAQYEEYRPHLIQHLVDRKVIHWDTALHQMTFLDPESMKLILSTQILPRCTNPELYLRHGSILASGKVISALFQVAKDHQRRLPDELGRFWRSFAGDPMRIAVCYFIQDLSSGGFPLLDAVVDRWLKALRECLASADSNVQQSAISAVTALIGEYFRHQPVEKLTALSISTSTISYPRLQWAESRKNALTALSLVCTTVGIAPSSPGGVDQVTLAVIFRTLIDGLEDYTVDSRGDIGAIVRESTMSSNQLEELRSIIPPPPLDISTEKECFDLWMKVMRLDTYRKAVITGLVSSIGSLTESLVKSSSAPFMSYLRQLVAENKLDELNLVTRDILNVFQENLNSVRLMPYIFNILDHLLSSGCLDSVFKSMSRSLLTLIRTEMTNGGKPLKVFI
ncbi:hypothetical protein DAPPUDRAFT_106183 [Daphnia pulex]|uniref:Uncharacterized protein n=1 Tax=Daphnia pulex TaxID=6669 RepID=E9GTB1_DAPPU|nr:hypothetical protein DAPPUDRAFT_106183 [Daphnia pulex]|eukprot:EFX77248.1 hypothetical protein DAPPUDRAFT_106183 [Daphnia pulex]